MKTIDLSTIMTGVWAVGGIASDTEAEFWICAFAATCFILIGAYSIWRESK